MFFKIKNKESLKNKSIKIQTKKDNLKNLNISFYFEIGLCQNLKKKSSDLILE